MNNDTGTATELRDLYRELILDHARSPRHFGKLEGATHSADGINPLCGDKLKLYFRLDGDSKIADARFEGSGCAISVASASLLTESVTGMSVVEATDFFHLVTASLSGKTATTTIDLGKLRALQGVKEFPARVKCATLAWHAMHAAFNRDHDPATTE
jgi:nitrogen fixation protein NifU and related proteins